MSICAVIAVLESSIKSSTGLLRDHACTCVSQWLRVYGASWEAGLELVQYSCVRDAYNLSDNGRLNLHACHLRYAHRREQPSTTRRQLVKTRRREWNSLSDLFPLRLSNRTCSIGYRFVGGWSRRTLASFIALGFVAAYLTKESYLCVLIADPSSNQAFGRSIRSFTDGLHDVFEIMDRCSLL